LRPSSKLVFAFARLYALANNPLLSNQAPNPSLRKSAS
jgi:hypothetical protein